MAGESYGQRRRGASFTRGGRGWANLRSSAGAAGGGAGLLAARAGRGPGSDVAGTGGAGMAVDEETEEEAADGGRRGDEAVGSGGGGGRQDGVQAAAQDQGEQGPYGPTLPRRAGQDADDGAG